MLPEFRHITAMLILETGFFSELLQKCELENWMHEAICHGLDFRNH